MTNQTIKNSIVVKINNKDYTLFELTLQEIIDLTEGSKYFKGKNKEENKETVESAENATEGIMVFVDDFKRVIKTSCDFDPEILLTFTPSQIKKLYSAFKEINSDFLDFLKALGIMEILTEIKDMALGSFSRMLVTSLNLDI